MTSRVVNEHLFSVSIGAWLGAPGCQGMSAPEMLFSDPSSANQLDWSIFTCPKALQVPVEPQRNDLLVPVQLDYLRQSPSISGDLHASEFNYLLGNGLPAHAKRS